MALQIDKNVCKGSGEKTLSLLSCCCIGLREGRFPCVHALEHLSNLLLWLNNR